MTTERQAVSDLIAAAVQTVPREHYTDHAELGSVPQSTAQHAIERDLGRAGVERGMRVMEIGTGTGYTGALLAEMVGPEGHVVSIDIDPELSDRAAKLHAERGLSNLTLVTADGRQGAADHGPYDVILGWASPTHIPQAWLDQTRPGGRIATPIYLAPVARAVGHVVVAITDSHEPAQPILGPAVYVDMGGIPNRTLGLPMFYADASNGDTDAPAYVSIAWRDSARPGDAQATLAMLHQPNLVQASVFSDDEREQATRWHDFRSYCIARSSGDGSNLTVYGTGAPGWILSIGFSSSRNAAVLTQDGQLIANSENSPALMKLREFMSDWHNAGKPGLELLRGRLVRQDPGWAVSPEWRAVPPPAGQLRTDALPGLPLPTEQR
ncbi:protein-L-isoaspartate O-methyltransferase family protein [Kribbella deserti]|uniref:Protein-L-isoaspartate O-methyltransferase n=1 Tax=Kribbella deserti TaxID=1926257 RepID=A0ABV6QGH8_9ACTN